MDATEYQKLALKTEKTPMFVIDEHGRKNDRMLSRLLHAAIGLCTETGELQDQIKKHLIYGKALDHVNVIEEIGDIEWYCALALDAVGATMSDAMTRNIAKLKARYGDKFSKETALNRDLVKERATLEERPIDKDMKTLAQSVVDGSYSDLNAVWLAKYLAKRILGLDTATRPPQEESGLLAPVNAAMERILKATADGGGPGVICHSPEISEDARFLALYLQRDVIRMNLCVIPHIFLTPGVFYRFEAAEGCDGCARYARGEEEPQWHPDIRVHAEFPPDDWRQEVTEENTSLGYHEWVVHRIDDAKNG